IEHLARVLLDIIVRGQRVGVLGRRSIDLVKPWNTAFDVLNAGDWIRRQDRDYWRKQAPQVLKFLGKGAKGVKAGAEADQWLQEALDKWQQAPFVNPPALIRDCKSSYQAFARLAHKIAEVLLDLRICEACVGEIIRETKDRSALEYCESFQSLYGYFV